MICTHSRRGVPCRAVRVTTAPSCMGRRIRSPHLRWSSPEMSHSNRHRSYGPNRRLHDSEARRPRRKRNTVCVTAKTQSAARCRWTRCTRRRSVRSPRRIGRREGKKLGSYTAYCRPAGEISGPRCSEPTSRCAKSHAHCLPGAYLSAKNSSLPPPSHQRIPHRSPLTSP